MTRYKIHPIVMGTKVFDKSMMTYQHGYGETYTIPIYCWYIEGGDQKVLVDTGEMKPIQSEGREKNILVRVKCMASIILPLHEPGFAAIETLPE